MSATTDSVSIPFGREEVVAALMTVYPDRFKAFKMPIHFYQHASTTDIFIVRAEPK